MSQTNGCFFTDYCNKLIGFRRTLLDLTHTSLTFIVVIRCVGASIPGRSCTTCLRSCSGPSIICIPHCCPRPKPSTGVLRLAIYFSLEFTLYPYIKVSMVYGINAFRTRTNMTVAWSMLDLSYYPAGSLSLVTSSGSIFGQLKVFIYLYIYII